MTEAARYLHSAQRTIRMEAQAVAALEARIGEEFEKACELILKVPGRTVVTGMGKSGHVGGKIAATLASTGTPAFFVHPGEASHGDMGMITADDCVIALSNSGTTPEVLMLVPLLKRLGVPLISMTGAPESALAQASDAHINTGVAVEACPLDLAPTSSTTTTLVMGDALAIALLEARGFTAEDFAFSHPGGALGRKLLLKIDDVMRQGDAIPRVSEDTPLSQALLEISAKGLGMTTVSASANGALVGVFTDGDLRRALDGQLDIKTTRIGDIMTRSPATVHSGILAAEALRIMEERHISALVVLDEKGQTAGVVNLLALLGGGYRMNPDTARDIKLLALDVDGVLTDGRITYGNDGEELKSFNIKDGLGIKLMQRAGVEVTIITGRQSNIVERRARELGIGTIIQGREDKLSALQELCDARGLQLSQCAYMGDDLPDLAAVTAAGIGMTVADASSVLLASADWRSSQRGGDGAVREACETLLHARGQLEALEASFK